MERLMPFLPSLTFFIDSALRGEVGCRGTAEFGLLD
jgi:hypothetical protein